MAESSRAAAERDSTAASGEGGRDGAPAAHPELARDVPLGFGAIEDLPDFVPLLEQLRGSLARRDRSLAEGLLPRQQLKDRNDNVQRLLRVLARGPAGGRSVGVREFTLPRPVVIRMPAPAVRRLLKDPANASKLRDPLGHFAVWLRWCGSFCRGPLGAGRSPTLGCARAGGPPSRRSRRSIQPRAPYGARVRVTQ